MHNGLIVIGVIALEMENSRGRAGVLNVTQDFRETDSEVCFGRPIQSQAVLNLPLPYSPDLHPLYPA